MKREIAKIILGFALALSTLAVPAHAQTYLTFTDDYLTGGTVAVSGTTVTGVSGAPFDTFDFYSTANNNLYEIDNLSNLSLSLSGTTLALAGQFPGVNTSPPSLLTIQLTGLPTNTGTPWTPTSPLTPGTLVVDIDYAAPVTVSTALLNALGINPATVTSSELLSGTNGLYLDGQEKVTGSGGPFNTDSNGFTVEISTTPEPASLLLFGSGLIGIALFVRRRSSQQA